jgi:hypothetical protein
MDYIGATPQSNPLLGLLAERLKQAQQFAAKPFGYQNPPAEMLMNLLGIPAVQQTAERLAYGEPLTTGRGMTTRPRPEAVEAALTVAPVAGLLGNTAEKGMMAAGRAGERYAERVVPQIMERGGLPAQLLGDLSYGSQSRIVPVDIAKQIDMPINLPQSKEFLKAVENEPSAKITDEGLLMNLRRMQTPEQSGMESVRTGVFYLPEGQAANLKHYKGKTGYGGAESIEGETLYKNPLFVKGATGGKAPESAYDSLMGKGSYEQMRGEVLKSYAYNANQSQKIEAVQGLLEKYNGLDSDDAYNMAYNIVSNSKGGNTLPYAIQENIVANAVRNAGHDAVIGYGKGKGDKGEFFSEVFDVREYAYPTPYGDFELMPEIEKKLRSNLLD